MAMLACVVPGLSSASESTPTADTSVLGTMVAEKVNAAIAQTEQAKPSPTRTPETADAPAPSTEEMEAPAPSDSSLALQNDGTTLFVDELAKYQLNVSPGWLPVRIDQQEYYDAFSLPAASDEAVQRALMDIKTLDPNIFRLFIYDLQDGHMLNGVITRVEFKWDPEGSLSLDGKADIEAAADALSVSIPNSEINSYSISSTTNEIPIGVILSEIPGRTFGGADVVLFQKHVYLNLPAGDLIISFTTEQNFKDATLPFFDTMIETLKINQE